MRILILEDNPDRRRKMSDCLRDRFPQYGIEFFDSAASMIERIEATRLFDAALISLNHDLDTLTDPDGGLRDPGTGAHVAEWLATQPAICPVVVHTTNTHGGDRIVELLTETGWSVERVVPHGDDWIEEAWFPTVRRMIVTMGDRMDLAQSGIQILSAHLRRFNSGQQSWRRDVVEELLHAAATHLSMGEASPAVSVELLYLNSERRWTAGARGCGVLETPFANPSGVAIIELEGKTGLGPVPITTLEASPEFVRALTSLLVTEIQVEIVNAAARGQALLFICARRSGQLIHNHDSQRIIGSLKSLLELTLMFPPLQFSDEPTNDNSQLTRQSSPR